MADIVERLRKDADWLVSCACGNIPDDARLWIDAAEEIDRLRSELSTASRAAIRCYVAEMKTTAGSDYFVTVECDGRQLTPHMHKIKGRAEYGVAEWNWLLNGGEKPDILTFDTEDDR